MVIHSVVDRYIHTYTYIYTYVFCNENREVDFFPRYFFHDHQDIATGPLPFERHKKYSQSSSLSPRTIMELEISILGIHPFSTGYHDYGRKGTQSNPHLHWLIFFWEKTPYHPWDDCIFTDIWLIFMVN